MPINVKLLRKVKKHILEEPSRFFMNSVIVRGAPGAKVTLDGIEREIPKCGTAACIAGWACILSGETEPIGMSRAEKLLGLDDHGGTRLFVEDCWPDKFHRRWQQSKTLITRAKIAAERIDHFIATKGRE